MGQRNLSKEVRDGINFTRALAKYVGDLSVFFLDWQERPDRFERFPLSRWVRVYKSMEPVTGDQLLGMLKEHERLLRLEEARVAPKGPVVVESTTEANDSHGDNSAIEIPGGEIPVGAKSVTVPDQLPKALERAMRQKGHLQKQACSALGVDVKTLRKLLNGRGKVLQRTIDKAANYSKTQPAISKSSSP